MCRNPCQSVATGYRKSPIPTRTIVAPSSMATSKSWLMPIESSRRWAAGTPLSPVGRGARAAGGTRVGRLPGFRQKEAGASAPRRGPPCSARPLRRWREACRGARRASWLRARDRPAPGGRAYGRRRPRPRRAACSRSTLSTEWIERRSVPRPFALCSIAGGRSDASGCRMSVACAIFCRASWTRFSPKSR